MIIFMGVAGSGKSTQAGMLAQKLGCHRVGVGDLLRMNMAGEQAKKMLKGEMISDELVLGLLEKEIKGLKDREFVLDGSPRSMIQAKWWVEKAKTGQVNITGVIHLKTSENIAKKRLIARHRPDDHEKAIAERFNEYHQTIKPIFEYFKNAGLVVHDINGERAPELVQADISQALGL